MVGNSWRTFALAVVFGGHLPNFGSGGSGRRTFVQRMVGVHLPSAVVFGGHLSNFIGGGSGMRTFVQ